MGKKTGTGTEMIQEEKKLSYLGANAKGDRRAFEIGKVIKGKYTGKYSTPSTYNPKKDLVTFYVETDTEKLGLNSCGDLADHFEGLEEGTEIAVEMVEIEKTKNNFDFRRFNVIIE